MAVTQLSTIQLKDEGVTRDDLNATTPGSAVVKRIIAGTNVTIGQTGVDLGTGDVTINATLTGGGGTDYAALYAAKWSLENFV